jgi:histidinol-phosphate/aromatic aminotransferase/cobyric acid decarboxylase-like protein
VINEHYRRLAFELDDGGKGDFVSGWQCENPFATGLLERVRRRCSTVDFTRYTYFDADEALVDSIKKFHLHTDGRLPEAVLCGPGASPLLATFLGWLANQKRRHVFYVPPIYHSILIGLQRYGISATSVSERQVYEADFTVCLPDESGVLILSDPLWYCGAVLPRELLLRIADWQRSTNSLVFVDGSLQYLSWKEGLSEHTQLLEPHLTFRLVSPCKQLAIHGYRFAYLIAPEDRVDEMAWISTNLTGPASAESIQFAHEAIEAVREQVIPRRLIDIAKERFRALSAANKIVVGPEPLCGYSVFCRIANPLPDDYVLMDGRYFDQPRYPGFVKVNLLSPSIRLLFH